MKFMKIILKCLSLCIMFLILIGCQPDIEYPLLKDTTYITNDNNIYFYFQSGIGLTGKLKTSSGEIYKILISDLGYSFDIDALREIGEVEKSYYLGIADFKKDKVAVTITTRKIDIDSELPNTIVFYKYDGEIIPDWAKEENITRG